MPEHESLNGHPDSAQPPDGQPREPRFNAFKHGCCAKTPVLPGEDEALWREVEQDWFDEYRPQTAIARCFVAAVALAFWNKKRCHLRLEQTDLALSPKNAMDWTDEEHLKYSRFLRYRTAADRTFSRAWRDAEYLRKTRATEDEALRRADYRFDELRLKFAKLESSDAHKDKDRELKRELAAQALRVSSKPAPPPNASPAKNTTGKKKKERLAVAEQWIEIRITNGLTTTEYYPPNEELIEELEDNEIEPEMVYRRLNFPDGVPPEYQWANLHRPNTCEAALKGEWCPRCAIQERGGCGIQRMTYQTWLQVIEREKNHPGRHAGPTGVGNLPQPKERGGDLDYEELIVLQQQQKDWIDSPDSPVK